MLKGVLQSLVHVKKITLGSWATEVLHRMEAKGLHSPVLKCECLTLDTGIGKSVRPSIAHMLENSPKLETLVISETSSSCHKKPSSSMTPSHDPGHRRPRNRRLHFPGEPMPLRTMPTWTTSALVDRLSELPNSILVHIISLLPIEYAIQTEVLSRRWKSLWTHSPSLLFRQYSYGSGDVEDGGFCYDDDPEEWKHYAFAEVDFVAFVDKILGLSNCSKVDRLEFDLEYKPSLTSNVDSWMAFATARGAEELHLRFHNECYRRIGFRDHWYELPQHLFANSSFRELHFCNLSVNPEGNVDWKSVKKLSIGDVKLSNELLKKILLGSPVLERLELYWYDGFSRLDIDNASLKKLVLRKYVGPTYENEDMWWPFGDNEEDDADGAHGAEDNEEDLADGGNPYEEYEAGDGHGFEEDEDGSKQDPRLVISAPHLESLEICGCLAKNCQLINVSSLVDAKLCCNWRWERSGEGQYIRVENELRGLLSSFIHVKSLTVGTWAMRVLSSMEAKGLSLSSLNCTSLMLEACLCDEAFPWIATMFGLSPNLETLVMTKSSSSSCWGCWKNELDSYKVEHYWTSQKRIFKCLSLHLKEVVFADLSWFHYESNFLSFVQFLLKNAKVLQKVTIKMSMYVDALPKEFFVAANKLLTFPRSSPDAVVMFCQ